MLPRGSGSSSCHQRCVRCLAICLFEWKRVCDQWEIELQRSKLKNVASLNTSLLIFALSSNSVITWYMPWHAATPTLYHLLEMIHSGAVRRVWRWKMFRFRTPSDDTDLWPGVRALPKQTHDCKQDFAWRTGSAAQCHWMAVVMRGIKKGQCAAWGVGRPLMKRRAVLTAWSGAMSLGVIFTCVVCLPILQVYDPMLYIQSKYGHGFVLPLLVSALKRGLFSFIAKNKTSWNAEIVVTLFNICLEQVKCFHLEKNEMRQGRASRTVACQVVSQDIFLNQCMWPDSHCCPCILQLTRLHYRCMGSWFAGSVWQLGWCVWALAIFFGLLLTAKCCFFSCVEAYIFGPSSGLVDGRSNMHIPDSFVHSAASLAFHLVFADGCTI